MQCGGGQGITANLIEEAVKNSENGDNMNAEVLKDYQDIAEKTNKVSQVVAEIAAACGQQDQGIGEVNKAVEQLNQANPAERGQCRGIGKRRRGDVFSVSGDAEHGGQLYVTGSGRIYPVPAVGQSIEHCCITLIGKEKAARLSPAFSPIPAK